MITILFFAHLQEEVGIARLEWDVQKITVRELKDRIKGTYSISRLEGVMVAINEEYAFDDDVIQSGDTVAFIPPVSGG